MPYGQLFLWIEQFVVWATNVHPEASIMLFRLAALVGMVLCVIYVPKLAELHGVNPNRALWLTAANPLFLTNFIASVHNDALMIGLALAGLYYCATRRVILGIVLVTLSISVKPITVVFLPFIGLLWAGKGASWPRKFVFWALTAGISLALLYLMSRVNGFGFGWINGLSAPGSIWIWYAPVGLLGLIVASISNAFGLDGWGLAKWAFDAGKLLAVGIVAWQIFRGDYDRLIRRLTLAFAAVVLLSPMIQSWYIVWLIPLFAVTGIRDDWQVKALYFIVSFFMVYAISDQLDVFPYLQTADLGLALALARNAAAIIALLFALYLIFLDPKTKLLFSKSDEPVTTRPDHLALVLASAARFLSASVRDSGLRSSAVPPHERPHPGRIRPGVFAQRPPDRLADEELAIVEVGLDHGGQQGRVRGGLRPQLRRDGGPPDPEVLVRAPAPQHGRHAPPGGPAGARPAGAPRRPPGPTRRRCG